MATYKGVSPRCNLEFSANEDHVFGGDEHSHAMCSWDTRSGFLLKRYSAHQGNVVYCGVSKSGEGIVSCSEDARARVWMSV